MNLMPLQRRHVLAAAVFFATAAVQAAPGAHGPNGEHLDAPQSGAASGSAVPRFEAKSESFELVGRLSGGELSLMIHRYETGEPVLKARVEVESGALKAVAPFHEDLGDYAVADEAFLKAVARQGEHPIVVTIVAGQDADLLEGTLVVSAAAARAAIEGGHDHDHGHSADAEHDHDHGWRERVFSPWGLAAAGGLLALGAWLVNRRRASSTPHTEQAQ